jgi:hypothetical protein
MMPAILNGDVCVKLSYQGFGGEHAVDPAVSTDALCAAV